MGNSTSFKELTGQQSGLRVQGIHYLPRDKHPGLEKADEDEETYFFSTFYLFCFADLTFSVSTSSEVWQSTGRQPIGARATSRENHFPPRRL